MNADERLNVIFLGGSESDARRASNKLAEGTRHDIRMDFAAGEADFDRLAASCRYQLVLLVPGQDAAAELSRIRSACPGVPVVCMAGAVGEEAVADMLRHGAADFVRVEGMHRLAPAALRALEGADAQEEQRRHGAFEQAISKLAYHSIHMPADRLDTAIVGAMGMIAAYCEADCIDVYRYDRIKDAAQHYLRWGREPPPHMDSAWCELPIPSIGMLMRRLEAGLEYVSNSPSGQPECGGGIGAAPDVHSICAQPMTADGRLVGMVTALTIRGEKTWSSDEVTALRLFAELMTSVLMRREAEGEIRQLAESYRLVLDSTNDGVAMLDRDGVILGINNAFVSHYDKAEAELIGHSLAEFMMEGRDSGFGAHRLACIRRAFDAGETVCDEDALAGLCYSNRYFPIFKNGGVAAVALFSTDITARKLADMEVRRRLETEARLNVMTEFFTNISHELRTPLSLILMQLDRMHMSMGNPGKLQTLMEDATLNAYRLTRLVTNLLDITKMDAGFVKLNTRRKDIVPLLRQIADSVKQYAFARGIALEFTTNTQAWRMDFDLEKIERAVLNLLSNAIKHTPEGGCITLSFAAREGAVTICVRDTGEGIPADKLDVIFDRFAQIGNRLSRRAEGCGIGLALVKSITELHGGKIRAQSEPGHGSAFTLELPVRYLPHAGRPVVVEGFDLKKLVMMELSDLYIKTGE